VISMIVIASACLGLTSPEVEPASPPADAFADNSCIQCHADLPGRLSEIVELEWRRSVHHDAGVTCEGCHGGDARAKQEDFAAADDWKHAAHLRRDPEFLFMQATDTGFVSKARGRNVSYFCGKCHAHIMEKHLGSPHGKFGDPTCLYCHGQGSHMIVDPDVEIIDTRGRAERGRCSPCHLAGSMETVKQIKEMLIETEQQIESTGTLHDDLADWGYQSLELAELHDQARVTRSRLRQTFHSFNLLEISNFAGEIRDTAERTEATHELIGNLRTAQRRQARDGGIAIVLLLAFAGLLVYYRHAFLHTGPAHADRV